MVVLTHTETLLQRPAWAWGTGLVLIVQALPICTASTSLEEPLCKQLLCAVCMLVIHLTAITAAYTCMMHNWAYWIHASTDACNNTGFSSPLTADPSVAQADKNTRLSVGPANVCCVVYNLLIVA
jgi:hypothetical protein